MAAAFGTFNKLLTCADADALTYTWGLHTYFKRVCTESLLW